MRDDPADGTLRQCPSCYEVYMTRDHRAVPSDNLWTCAQPGCGRAGLHPFPDNDHVALLAAARLGGYDAMVELLVSLGYEMPHKLRRAHGGGYAGPPYAEPLTLVMGLAPQTQVVLHKAIK